MKTTKPKKTKEMYMKTEWNKFVLGLIVIGALACGSSKPTSWTDETEKLFAEQCGQGFNFDILAAPYCVCVSSELEKTYSDEEIQPILQGSISESDQKSIDAAKKECESLVP